MKKRVKNYRRNPKFGSVENQRMKILVVQNQCNHEIRPRSHFYQYLQNDKHKNYKDVFYARPSHRLI
jgi:hypothetical protein